MNKIAATVSKIDNVDNLNIVEFQFNSMQLTMLSLGLKNITIGTKVNLIIKPTHVSVAKQFQGQTSFENILLGKLVDMERGKLLCNIKIKIDHILIESIITMASFKQMDLKLNDELYVFIKANDISILEVIHD